MDGLTIDDLRARHADLAAAREDAQHEARERDLGFAYALGELEHLIGLLEERQNPPAKDAAP
jgi:hypothetical protein